MALILKSRKRAKPPLKRAKKVSAKRPRQPGPPEMPIEEVSAGLAQLAPYPAHGLCTFELLIERLDPEDLERAWELRYENARAFVADWINSCRELDLTGFRRAAFDIWIGQACGNQLGRTMRVTFATTAGLPELKFIDLIRDHVATAILRRDGFSGDQPVHLGSYPELRIADGTVAHAWTLSVPFLSLASDRYRRFNKLLPDVDDVYRQLARDERLPDAFAWDTLTEGDDEAGPNVFIFEVVTDEKGKQGPRITAPHQVLSISDVYDLEDQLELAHVDILGEEFTRTQRRQHFYYVRPALRAYCEWFKRPMPTWLMDDAIFNELPEPDSTRLFGVAVLKARTFKPTRKIGGSVKIVRKGDDDDTDTPS